MSLKVIKVLKWLINVIKQVLIVQKVTEFVHIVMLSSQVQPTITQTKSLGFFIVHSFIPPVYNKR